jgi:hypothetical protein
VGAVLQTLDVISSVQDGHVRNLVPLGMWRMSMNLEELKKFREMRASVGDITAAQMADTALNRIEELEEQLKKLQVDLAYERQSKELTK